MKNVMGTHESVNPCSGKSDGRRHVMFASRPSPHFFPIAAKEAVREGLGTRLRNVHVYHHAIQHQPTSESDGGADVTDCSLSLAE